MTRLPFFNKYPYTNFEQLNLDWLMNTVGSFESRVDAVETKVSELDTKVDTFDDRITQNTDDIAGIKTRLDDDEDDLDGLKDRMTTAEGNITSLTGRVDDHDDDIADLKTRMTGAEGDVDQLQNDLGNLESDVEAIPIVTANPGGTVTGSLTTLKIGDTIYQITGGGGGSGTEVIANPSGTAVADLNKVSIAGVIYDIPQPTVDSTLNTQSHNAIENAPVATAIEGINTSLSSLGSDIQGLDGRTESLEDDVAAINDLLNVPEIQFTNYRDDCQLNQSYDIASGVVLPAGTYIVEYEVYVRFDAGLVSHPGYYQLWAGYLDESGNRPGLAEEIIVTPDAQAAYTHFVTCCKVVKSTGTATLDVRTHVNGPYYAGGSAIRYHLSVAAHAVRVR